MGKYSILCLSIFSIIRVFIVKPSSYHLMRFATVTQISQERVSTRENIQSETEGHHNDAQAFPAYVSSIFIKMENYHFNWIMQSHRGIRINMEMKESLAEALVPFRKKQLLQIQRVPNNTDV